MGVCECVGNCVRAPETIRQKRTAAAGKAQRRIFALLALPESGHSMGTVIISHCGSTNTLSGQVFKEHFKENITKLFYFWLRFV